MSKPLIRKILLFEIEKRGEAPQSKDVNIN